MHIGILEDDLAQLEIYKAWLSTAQHKVSGFTSAKDFKEALNSQSFDLLVIDMVLPESSGLAVLQWVRENKGWDLPIIFVTSVDTEIDIVSTLRAGADDYIIKPAKFLEFIARIESISRRSRPAVKQQIGIYEINSDVRQIKVKDQLVELTQKEFELACYFFQNPGKLLSRIHLLEKLWGLNSNVDTRTVDTHVSRIRRKLQIESNNGWQIIPVYGYGYRIEKLDTVASE
jgi:DNA-binding response OmpR family regulator